jgi:hypothetical protein
MEDDQEPFSSEHIGRWYRDVQQSSAAQFAEHHPGLFFLVYQSDRPLGRAEFQTADYETSVVELVEAIRSGQCKVGVLPIRKSSRNPYPDRISLGRARNCDIVLRHPSVSKLHAHIRAQQNGSYTITDLGSRNGTSIGDHALAPRQPEPLHPNNRVVFGTVAAHALDGATLHAALIRLCDLLNSK